MAMYDNEIPDEVREPVDSLEQALGLPVGFCGRLKEEDDWSFIIKSHALVETAFTRLLEARMCPPLPSKFINTLDFSGGRHSKLELLCLLDLADNANVKFARGLSKIRNRLVHNISHVGFKLADYVAALADQDAKAFAAEACCPFYSDNSVAEERKRQLARILAAPKLFLWRSVVLFLAEASLRIDCQKLESETEALRRETLKLELERARRTIDQLNAALGANAAFGLDPGFALSAYRERLAKHSANDSAESGPVSPSAEN
jgi:hypothetical protein